MSYCNFEAIHQLIDRLPSEHPLLWNGSGASAAQRSRTCQGGRGSYGFFDGQGRTGTSNFVSKTRNHSTACRHDSMHENVLHSGRSLHDLHFYHIRLLQGKITAISAFQLNGLANGFHCPLPLPQSNETKFYKSRWPILTC